ncbi:MAG TPA: NAD(P)-dependent oxidoreductase [Rhodocyclaceae bacterium]
MRGRRVVAVTGASGFIGRHVVAALAGEAVEVVAVTRNAARLPRAAESVRVVELDLGEPGADAFERLGRPDVLVHLAWDGLPNYRSLHHFETELPRQYAFLKSLVRGGLESMVVAGTCFEYGLQAGGLSEETSPQPVTPYGLAKDALRRQLEFLRADAPFALTWARLFYTYGDGQPATSLLPLLRAAVERGDRSFDMSGGEQLRDYLPVGEISRLIAALALKHPDSGAVNVCSGTPVSIRRLVEKWIAENGWDLELNLGRYPYPDYEPLAFWGDPRKLHRLTGVAPGQGNTA